MSALATTTALIKHSKFFSCLNDAEAEELAKQARISTFSAGTQIFRQNDPADSIYLIHKGEVELAVRTPGDDLLILSQLKTGEVLGDAALLQDTQRMVSARAVSDIELIVLEQNALAKYTSSNTAAAIKIHLRYGKLLSKRIRNNNNSLSDKKPSKTPPSPGQILPHSTNNVSPRFQKVLRHMPFFHAFSEPELDKVTNQFTEHHLNRGQLIFAENATGDSCFLVTRGAVEISMQTEQGKRRLAVFGPGRMFGEMCLLDGGTRGASCTVRETAVVLQLSAQAFNSLLESNSSLALKFITAINQNLTQMLLKANANLVAINLHQFSSTKAPEGETTQSANAQKIYQRDSLVEKIRESVIGDNLIIDGPFGPCRMVYADYTATGRSLTFIEDFIRYDVMPYYANTHTESSGTGLQTTRLREDARNIILQAVGGSEEDVVIFSGSGATSAIDKMITVLGLKLPYELDQQYRFTEQIPEDQRPVVFVGPYEHHSNDVTWRMSIADTVMIDEDKDGRIDIAQLEQKLIEYRHRPLKVGSFSAASNVTGIISDDHAIAALLHQYGALSFWDFAAASPYIDINMNPGDNANKDAVFISPHKFIGGPGTPGVLIAKKSLFTNKVPSIPGGGTVEYVSTDGQAFLKDPVHREEGGTPAIIESIRAGLVFQLKDSVGAKHIEKLEHGFVTRAIKAWQKNPNIWLLGNPKLKRLSIISLVIRHGDQYLHWNYVVALLNDLFGIQARGGCSCAGPYGHRLFGIDSSGSKSFQCEISNGYEGIKPGWVRLNFNYFISEQVFNYLVAAIDLVATHGWKLLPLYRFNPRTAMWSHMDGPPKPALSLADIQYTNGELEIATPQTEASDAVLEQYLERGRELLLNAAHEFAEISDPELPDAVQALRWFPLPAEIAEELKLDIPGVDSSE